MVKTHDETGRECNMEERAQKELARLVAIRSESGQEQAILAYLEARLEALGLSPVRQTVDGDRFNLIWTESPRPKLLLSAHVDTIPAFDHPDRYGPRLEGGRLYGRGSADAKAGIAAILLALELTLEKGLKDPSFAVAFTVDEEREGLGSKVLPEVVRAEGAVVLEPTELMLCPAEAGSLEVRLTIEGAPAHGSAFEAGKNPILQAASLIEAFKRLSFVKGSHPLIGEGGFNIMEVKGGLPALLVPERCELFVDFRILPGQDPEAAKAELLQLFTQEAVKAEFLDVSPPFELHEDEPILQLMKQAFHKALGEAPRIGGMKSWTDAEHLYASGIPSVVFGPGRLALAHTPWEHVELKEVVKAARVLHHAITANPP
ncbi:MAG: M20 family metallopeptidase [Candidatus Methylomirabilales bacterium]